MPRIHIIATGGTIASRRDPDTGVVVPAVDAASLVAAVPAVADVAEIDVTEVARVSSWDLSPATMVAVARRIEELALETPSPDGFVVTHGTDTMEETAFVLDATLDVSQPIVLTGAMRAADAPGADGPANLVDAVRFAASDAADGLGAVVVMAGEVHAARHVTKVHTARPAAFASPGVGPLGTVEPERPVVRWGPEPVPPLPPVAPHLPVPLATMVAGLDDLALRAALDADVRGLVLAGSGAGNVDATVVPMLRELVAAGCAVVLASRCAGGRVHATYGGPGGGASLREAGLIAAGDLSAPKARLALSLLLGADADRDEVAAWFGAL